MRLRLSGILPAVALALLAITGCSSPGGSNHSGGSKRAKIGPAFFADFRDGNTLAGLPMCFDFSDPSTEASVDEQEIQAAIADGRIARWTPIEIDVTPEQRKDASEYGHSWELSGVDIDGIRGGDLRRVRLIGSGHRPIVVIADPDFSAGPNDLAGQIERLGLSQGAPAYISRYGLLYETNRPDIYLIVRAPAPGSAPIVEAVARVWDRNDFAQSEEFWTWELYTNKVQYALETNDSRNELGKLVARAELAKGVETDAILAGLAARLAQNLDPALAEAEARGLAPDATLDDRAIGAIDAVFVAFKSVRDSGRAPSQMLERVHRCVGAFGDACAAQARRATDEQRPVESAAFAALAAAAGFDPAAPQSEAALESFMAKLQQIRDAASVLEQWPAASFEDRADLYTQLVTSSRELGLDAARAAYAAELLAAAREHAEVAAKDGRLATAAGLYLAAQGLSGGAAATDKVSFGAVIEGGVSEGAGPIDRARQALAFLVARLVPVPDPAGCWHKDALVTAFDGGGMLGDSLASVLAGLEVGSQADAAETLTKLGLPLGRFEVTELEGDLRETSSNTTVPVRWTERQVLDQSAARDERTAELLELKKQIDDMAGALTEVGNLANGYRDDALLARVAFSTQTRAFDEAGYGQDMQSRKELYRDRLATARNELIDRYNDRLATRPLATSERTVEHEEFQDVEGQVFTGDLERRLSFTGARGSASERQTYRVATEVITGRTYKASEIRDFVYANLEEALPAAAATMFAKLFADQLVGYASECSSRGGPWASEERWASCLLADREHRDPGLSRFMEAVFSLAPR